MATAEVQGVRATLAELRKTERSLYYKSVARMKAAAKPLAAQVDANYPREAPMSGFDHNGRTGWRKRKVTRIRVGGRRSRAGDWPLLRIIIDDGPRQIFDLADNGKLSDALVAHGYGAPSRAAWRDTEQLRAEVTEAVVEVVRSVSKTANQQMRRVQ